MVIYDRKVFSSCLKFCKRCICNGRPIEKRLRYGGKQERRIALVKASTVTENFLLTAHLNRLLDRRSAFMTRGPVVSSKKRNKDVRVLNFGPELADLGIGVHHAGLALEDRRKVEGMFIKGTLRIIIATSVESRDF